MKTVAILGGGAMGETLLRELPAAGLEVVRCWNRSRKRPPWTTRLDLGGAQLVLLAVSDGAVGPLCERLDVGRGQLVAHLAGALTLAPLEAGRRRGARTGSIHPLRALVAAPRGQTLRGAAAHDQTLRGAAAGIAGSDAAARRELTLVARRLGMKPLPVGDRARPLYHAAAVLSAGGQVALFAQAVRAFRKATGASEEAARKALLPLALGALGKLAESDAAAAITGPAVRGDAETIAGHRAALPAELLPLYDALALVAVELAWRGKRAPAAALERVRRELLEGRGSG
jgi:predicted short-subunit dehydrogenase-like oxidoreductase (DUF2520 family)